MLALARRAAWSIPIGITFTDLVGTVIRVEGASMQPTFNPPESTSNDWVLVEKVSVKWLHRYERGAIMVLW